MAVGQYSNVGFSGYLAIGREVTFATYSTCTAAMDFKSAKFNTLKDSKVIEAVRNSRTLVDRIQLGKVVGAEVEFNMASDNDASQYIMQNAMGGGATGAGIVSSTSSGDTVGAGVFDHVQSLGNFDVTYTSLCFSHRKGDATHGKIFEYSGGRVDEFSLKAEIDEPLVASASLILVDCTVTSNSAPAALLTATGMTPLSFVNMRFSIEDSFASLTAGAFWHVQSIEFSIKNNLKSDSDSRRIGSDLLQVLPPGLAMCELSVSMRWDTLTAYNAMLNGGQMSAQMVFEGATITGSTKKQLIQIDLPRVYIKDAGDPEIGGPDEILKADIKFDVLQDDSSASGYMIKTTVRNKTSSY